MPAKSAHGRNLPEGESVSEPNWMARQFIASPKLPVRFYLDAGTEEIDFSGGGNSILLTTRNLRDVLRAKGYEVHFQEFAGGHGYLSWRGTLADGLIALLGNAPEHAVGEPAASRK
jgi:enterochelin esterase family protein